MYFRMKERKKEKLHIFFCHVVIFNVIPWFMHFILKLGHTESAVQDDLWSNPNCEKLKSTMLLRKHFLIFCVISLF